MKLSCLTLAAVWVTGLAAELVSDVARDAGFGGAPALGAIVVVVTAFLAYLLRKDRADNSDRKAQMAHCRDELRTVSDRFAATNDRAYGALEVAIASHATWRREDVEIRHAQAAATQALMLRLEAIAHPRHADRGGSPE